MNFHSPTPLSQNSPYAVYFDIDADQALFHVVVLSIAYLITLPIGFERSRVPSGLGLRTIGLVSITCCAFVLMGVGFFSEQDAQSRLFYGILTGIGFIGGGALFKSSEGVRGTASAASVWSAAAIGMSVGLALLEIAIVLSIVTTVTLVAFSRPYHDSDLLVTKNDKRSEGE